MKATAASGSGSNGKAVEPKFVARLSRRVVACDECRKTKVKCHLAANGSPPCTRCVKNGVECKLTKSLQTILDERLSDGEWKNSVEKRLEAILKAMEASAGNGSPPAQAITELQRVMQEEREKGSKATPEIEEYGTGERPSKRSKRVDTRAETSDSPDGNLGLLADAASVGESSEPLKKQWDEEALAEPASAPGEHLRLLAPPSIYSTIPPTAVLPAKVKRDRSRKVDIIDQGLITLSQACTLIDLYLQKLDLHVYSIVALQHCPSGGLVTSNALRETVTSIRKCPLLLLAICTVASLHCSRALGNDGIQQKHDSSPVAIRLHKSLYNEFVRVSAQRSFERHQSTDDVRALLVASWWLRDLTWILTASSVRLVTERGMQEAFKRCSDVQAGKAWVAKGSEQSCFAGCAIQREETAYSEGEKTAYEEARLYYLVYIADHQAAIPFGRPPMTRQHAAVRNARAWLAGCRLAGLEDARLVSHVELWVISHDMVDDFGVDVNQYLSKAQVLEQVPRFDALIERWLTRWMHNISNIEELAVLELEADMMKLFLDAHAFRAPQGISPLLIEDDQSSAPLDLGDRVEQRESFAFKSLPSLAIESLTERQSRLGMGTRAVQSAHRILDYYRRPSTQALGQPIYPHVMLIFACLFLNKLSKTYGDDQQAQLLDGTTIERLTLPNCERGYALDKIEGVLEVLRLQVVGKCITDHLCSTAVSALNSIVAESKRQMTRHGTHQRRPTLSSKTLLSHQSTLSSSPSTSLTGLEPPLPSLDFDLQSLDLLSDTRFLSGISSNDVFLWLDHDFEGGQNVAW